MKRRTHRSSWVDPAWSLVVADICYLYAYSHVYCIIMDFVSQSDLLLIPYLLSDSTSAHNTCYLKTRTFCWRDTDSRSLSFKRPLMSVDASVCLSICLSAFSKCFFCGSSCRNKMILRHSVLPCRMSKWFSLLSPHGQWIQTLRRIRNDVLKSVIKWRYLWNGLCERFRVRWTVGFSGTTDRMDSGLTKSKRRPPAILENFEWIHLWNDRSIFVN